MMLESRVESHLVAGVELRGGSCLKLADAGRRGFPDRTVLMPYGRVIFVETKIRGGKLASWQERYHQLLRNLDFRVEVLWTIEHVDVFLESL